MVYIISFHNKCFCISLKIPQKVNLSHTNSSICIFYYCSRDTHHHIHKSSDINRALRSYRTCAYMQMHDPISWSFKVRAKKNKFFINFRDFEFVGGTNRLSIASSKVMHTWFQSQFIPANESQSAWDFTRWRIIDRLQSLQSSLQWVTTFCVQTYITHYVISIFTLLTLFLYLNKVLGNNQF